MSVAAHRLDHGEDGEWIVLKEFSAPHRFGTRRFVSADRRTVAGVPLLTTRQVHGDAVFTALSGSRAASSWQSEAATAEADAVVTDRDDCWTGVTTADCIPLLLHDPIARAVAAVHAGWRGAVMGVAPSAVRALVTDFGADPSRMEAAIGPHIGICCFEVGRAVLDPLSEYPDADRWLRDRKGDKAHFDLASFVCWQLERAGVAASRIVALGLCTRCDPERFSSYRREGRRPPGMLSAVGLGR